MHETQNRKQCLSGVRVARGGDVEIFLRSEGGGGGGGLKTFGSLRGGQ